MTLTLVFKDNTPAHSAIVGYGSIKPIPRDASSLSDGQKEDTISFYPDTVAVSTKLTGGLAKGEVLIVDAPVWKYTEKVNSYWAYLYTRALHAMFMNIDNNYQEAIPYSTGRVERITCGANVFAWTAQNQYALRMLSRHVNMDWNSLDPKIHNWFNEPYYWIKPQAIDITGKVIRPHSGGQGRDVYFPLLEDTNPNWIDRRLVELWPVGPRYRFAGLDVYDGDVPLMTVEKNGTRIFHHPEKFILATPSVIPPIGWKA